MCVDLIQTSSLCIESGLKAKSWKAFEKQDRSPPMGNDDSAKTFGELNQSRAEKGRVFYEVLVLNIK